MSKNTVGDIYTKCVMFSLLYVGDTKVHAGKRANAATRARRTLMVDNP